MLLRKASTDHQELSIGETETLRGGDALFLAIGPPGVLMYGYRVGAREGDGRDDEARCQDEAPGQVLGGAR